MLKKIFFPLIFMGLMGSWMACETPEKSPIDPQKMVAILADLHLADALAERDNALVKDSVAKIYYKQIFAKHGIDKRLFDTSLAIIAREPADLDSLYNQVTRRIQSLKK